jgi:hypothetical protein
VTNTKNPSARTAAAMAIINGDFDIGSPWIKLTYA